MKLPALRVLLLSTLAAGAAGFLPAQSIAIQRLDNFTQTSASAPTEVANPFSFTVNLRRGSPTIDMSGWGPAFYLPGSGGVPGSPNFPGSPNNNGVDYLFTQHFATSGDLLSAYPTGSYGLVFSGGTAPSQGSFTAGLGFTSGGFASVAPMVTGMNNGATWAGGLQVSTTGTTFLDINTSLFTEYGSGPGTFAIIGLYDSLGNVVSTANSFYIPTLTMNDSLWSQFAINGALLSSGSNYTLDIQYGILASTPGSALLNTDSFDGTATYYMKTSINVTAVPEPSAYAAMAGLLALGWAALRRRRLAGAW